MSEDAPTALAPQRQAPATDSRPGR